ncbi:MAG: formyltransferase family protein [Chloroflexota bacterium]
MSTASTPEEKPRIVFAGDRDIALWVLSFLVHEGVAPVALMLAGEGASHTRQLLSLCPHLCPPDVFRGNEFKSKTALKHLRELKPDYIISVHFPYILPKEVLALSKHGVLNLHPAYLPYNRGWHTPTWAIWEGTPFGATLHFMREEVDAGDIVHQKKLEVRPDDTADSLYQRVKGLELEVFKEGWRQIVTGKFKRKSQPAGKGTLHNKADIAKIQMIDLDERVPGDLLRKLRALTTNKIEEAAYFEVNGKKYRVQVKITEEG